MPTNLKAISFFSGIGGFDLGFERAGIQIVGQCEFDKYCNTVLGYHYPNVEKTNDIRKLSFRKGKGWKRYNHFSATDADIFVGGFPCQDISVAGKRAGLVGEKSGLWFEFHRLIGEFRPRWIVIENVPGLLSSNEGRDMGTILGSLAQLRYGYAYRVLDAQYFGVAQRRRRVFIIANSRDWHYPAKVLFEPESCERHTAPSRETGEEIAGTLSYGTTNNHWDHTRDNYQVARCLTVREGSRKDAESENMIPVAFQQNTRDEVRKMGGDGDIAGVIQAQSGMKQQNYITWQATTPESIRVQKDNSTSPTLTKYMGTGVHNVPFVGVRRLTPTECERLQGFPDGHTNVNKMSDTQRYKQLGNAVCVNVVEWIGKRIAMVENGEL